MSRLGPTFLQPERRKSIQKNDGSPLKNYRRLSDYGLFKYTENKSDLRDKRRNSIDPSKESNIHAGKDAYIIENIV